MVAHRSLHTICVVFYLHLHHDGEGGKGRKVSISQTESCPSCYSDDNQSVWIPMPLPDCEPCSNCKGVSHTSPCEEAEYNYCQNQKECSQCYGTGHKDDAECHQSRGHRFLSPVTKTEAKMILHSSHSTHFCALLRNHSDIEQHRKT